MILLMPPTICLVWTKNVSAAQTTNLLDPQKFNFYRAESANKPNMDIYESINSLEVRSSL